MSGAARNRDSAATPRARARSGARGAALGIETRPPMIPKREKNAHKGDAGKVGVLAGSRGMSGAAILSGLGALRAGAGLVRIFTPASVQSTVAAAEPSFMTHGLPEGAEGRIRLGRWPAEFAWPDVWAAGPGLGQSRHVARLIAALIERSAAPIVLDADGLNALQTVHPKLVRSPSWWRAAPARELVLTPHPGEMRRLLETLELPAHLDDTDASRLECAEQLSRATGGVVVLKGHRTVVVKAFDGDAESGRSTARRRAYVNSTGNSGMATGGMGDVLTGVIAALIAQGMPAYEAACAGVHLHGAAGDRCAKTMGPRGYTARELAAAIPGLFG